MAHTIDRHPPFPLCIPDLGAKSYQHREHVAARRPLVPMLAVVGEAPAWWLSRVFVPDQKECTGERGGERGGCGSSSRGVVSMLLVRELNPLFGFKNAAPPPSWPPLLASTISCPGPDTDGGYTHAFSLPLLPMHTALLAFLARLCLSLASAPIALASKRGRGHSASAGGLSPGSRSSSTSAAADSSRGQGQPEMASTALDFREMMRKERELALKKLAATPSSPKARYHRNIRLQQLLAPRQ